MPTIDTHTTPDDINKKLQEAEELEIIDEENSPPSPDLKESELSDEELEAEEEKRKAELKAKEETPDNEPPKEEPKKEDPEEGIDYKQRYSDSTKEAQVLAARNKTFIEKIEQAKVIPEPTDEEMTKIFADWDMKDDDFKKLAKENVMNQKRFELVGKAADEQRESDRWKETVRGFANNPENSSKFVGMAGREEEFVIFCAKPTRVGLELEDLAKAFLFEKKNTMPERKRSSLLESASGGDKPKPKILSVEDISWIRKNDPRKYATMVRQGKVKIDL